MKNLIFSLSLILFISVHLAAQNKLIVPTDFPSIQEGINNSLDSDTVLVLPGTYIENINLNGKNIFLTSQVLYTNLKSSITETIIDGSQPTSLDTGSVIRIVSGETLECVINGFTITGGTGTKTFNVNENLFFRTGGGITIDQSSPTITNNIITRNTSLATAGVSGAGGGGIRAGNGLPVIENNIISYNSGGYAGGIMMAYCEGMVFNNNVVAYNHCTGDFGGGGGIYVDWEDVYIVNNTIAYNSSGHAGAALCITGNTSCIQNCIIYGNEGITSQAVIRKRFNGDPVIKNTNIQGGHVGEDNIDVDPLFIDTIDFILKSESPSIDAGNMEPMFNDREDPNNATKALFPSHGFLRNDQGAYGGQGGLSYEDLLSAVIEEKHVLLGIEFWTYDGQLFLDNKNERELSIASLNLRGQLIQNIFKGKLSSGVHTFNLSDEKVQILQIQNTNKEHLSKIMINIK